MTKYKQNGSFSFNAVSKTTRTNRLMQCFSQCWSPSLILIDHNTNKNQSGYFNAVSKTTGKYRLTHSFLRGSASTRLHPTPQGLVSRIASAAYPQARFRSWSCPPHSISPAKGDTHRWRVCRANTACSLVEGRSAFYTRTDAVVCYRGFCTPCSTRRPVGGRGHGGLNEIKYNRSPQRRTENEPSSSPDPKEIKQTMRIFN